jgi:hypothetical protein
MSKKYEKATFWVTVINSILILTIMGWNLIISIDMKKTIAEPNFEITFDQATPPLQISSQKANPFIVFTPRPDMYDTSEDSKIHGKKGHISITNKGQAPSPQTFVEITVENPFSIALIAVYLPEFGWLNPIGWTVQIPDSPNYQEAKVTITKVIGQKKKLDIYLEVVYSKSKKEMYIGQEKIEDALKIVVHSSVQKINSPSAKTFPLNF